MGIRTKKTITHETATVVQNPDGTIERGIVSETRRIEAEPPFVKQYIEDIAYLSRCQSATPVLEQLLNWMSYSNEIPINKHVKCDIANKLGITEGAVYKQIRQLMDHDVLQPSGRAMVRANPFLFGRGTWSEISRMRDTYGKDFSMFLRIKYSEQGGREIVSSLAVGSRATQSENYQLEQEVDGVIEA